MSDPSRPCTQAGTSSGHVFKVPSPTMTAILVPTVCRSALDGFRMQCSRESCKSKQLHVRHSEYDTHMQQYGKSCSCKWQAMHAWVLLMMQTVHSSARMSACWSAHLDIMSVLFWQSLVLLLQIVLQQQACALPHLATNRLSKGHQALVVVTMPSKTGC